MIVNEVRSVSIWTAILAAIFAAAMTSGPAPDTSFENAFVTVGSISPSTRYLTMIADCKDTKGFPFVRLFVPNHQVEPTAALPPSADLQSVSATYFASHSLFGCTGVQEGVLVYITLKSRPPKSPFEDDAVKMDPSHNEVLLDNDRVRVVRIHFAPGESSPIVDKWARVIVAVTDSHATVTFPDGHSEPRDMKAGTVSFGNAGRQATKNTGTTPLENIVVELKGK